LEPEDAKRFNKVLIAKVEKESDSLESYYGEVIYQRSFLTFPDVRSIFGNGIVKAGNAKNVEGLFRSFINEFMNWFKRKKDVYNN